MVRRVARAVSLVRDAAVATLSLTVILSQYSRLGEEEAFVVTISLSAVVLALCLIDVALVSLNRGRGAMTGIAAIQVALGAFWFLLFPPVGLVMIAASAAVLAALREKKTPEELLKHPPVPRTRNYRVAVAAGALLVVLSLFLPWFSVPGASVSLYDVYRAIATHSGGLPSVSLSPPQVLFALLAVFGSPAAALCAALALRWRRLSFVAGAISAGAGSGFAVALGNAGGPGGYLLAVAGVILLVGFIAFRGRGPAKPL